MLNHRMVGYMVSRMLLVVGLLMLLPLFVTLYYNETAIMPFVVPIIIQVAIGLIFGIKKPKDTSVYAADGMVIVALSWLLISAFGALPFYLSGSIPNYIDAFFESVSGFTTTGGSIIESLEGLEHGILFWRSFTHFIGGMGVLVFLMAVLPLSDGHSMHLMRAEVAGPSMGKFVSKMSTMAKILYLIYIVLTVIEILFLSCGGMTLFDACVHSFGTAGTGGFGIYGESIGYYNNPYFEIVISVFMMLFGINFTLYYFILIGKIREFFRSEELRWYAGIVAVSVIAIAANILPMVENIGDALRQAFFQVTAIITTTGYATADFNTWPALSRCILLILMFTGACAGSTGGGLKISRVVVAVKSMVRTLKKMLHPNGVFNVHFEHRPMEPKAIHSINTYLIAFIVLFVISLFLISLDEACSDFETNFTAVTACINNIGPGFGRVGPTGNFAFYSWFSKLILSADMLIGRLEIYPILLLFAPSVWKRKQGFKKRIRR